ncbi:MULTISPECIES: RdgB/HAM1 family non-canonical purine NTP pyrophosphatase [unclassified Campylobacter]|uniref:RdgB/HAM1 family non-canonical purine NTP pyrophosphatase n=1 Tax=unclassified Campylobacter TaxID=2593542 RepID=UPI001BD99D92|nr:MULTISPECIES: RdgB/HAM1 family non-canonical purine NTP pyrophosphatase [unclassified Campylobacter]MBZ7976230.1 RdgB/HAM1 family non-canonical purine NTP pyrophosphatase [Campylobacter sp. RM12637]MBZ7979694.1 RdgB/HAM1 family non-canonical purine NTP pyrophosphatase [Campylobacter sp. RM12642]MBZ7981623.1 RdgB/HAM1 family non-canonical purine NTP pyrophosphatase [Campylobacter sp. RM12640]MBZ7984319.1 RdgB/HAM1 family non-canonical purine NTP pyrophosphatase [Campylobacter sp. RM12647]MBZ
MKIIIASSNSGKLKEFKELLTNCELYLASDFVSDFNPIENGNSFKQNAKIKAKALWDKLSEEDKKNYAVLADDSGLCVEALDNAPGIFSARYANDFSDEKDAKNREKLRLELTKVGVDFSKASFVCVLCLITNSKIEFAKGVCDGTISKIESGNNGFGYDSMFIPLGLSKTFAELSQDEKNKISHRFKALEELKKIF